MTEAPPGTVLRRGTREDVEACHTLLWAAATDLGVRHGTPLAGSAADWWSTGEPLHRYLAEHSAEWWVAEEVGSGEVVAYARSVERGPLFELTEFFVRPDRQSRGVGRSLLGRAFPAGRGDPRVIVATGEVRALASYYRSGVAARFPIFSLTREPREDGPPGDLSAERVDVDGPVDLVAGIEREVLGYARSDVEIRWLLGQREGYLYRRGDRVFGFAFIGASGSGPIAALDPGDLPAIIGHVEGRARAVGLRSLEFEVPAPNEIAIRHLLGRGFRLDRWVNYLMSDRPFGQFDRFIPFNPPIFL